MTKTAKYRLVFAMDIVRHGDRAPLYRIPGLSDHWDNMALGELTERGALESEVLGKHFRRYYIEKTKLLSSEYKKQDMRVRSTDSQRTKDTAHYILQGFYPAEVNEIDVVVHPKDEDGLLRLPGMMRKELSNKYVLFNTTEKDAARVKAILHKIGPLFSLDREETRSFLKIAGVLKVNKFHNIPPPKGITSEEEEEILTLAKTLQINRYQAPELVCATTSKLVENIVSNMESYAGAQQSLKYILYTTHDTNLAALLSFMSYQMNSFPPYNAYIKFELFVSDNTELYVRVSYNGEALSICSTEYCPLEEFIKQMKYLQKLQCTQL